jgi:PKD repeat protein
MMENAEAAAVMQHGAYEHHLATTYAYASHYYAVCHPSAPNYLALTSGKAWQCGSDGHSVYSTANLGSLAQNAGLSWAGFEESMPKPCDTSNSYPYAVKHNPFAYYANLQGNSTLCKTHDLNFTAWTSDVAKGTIPNLAFFTPNLKNDGHDTGVAYGDSWLKGWLTPLLNKSFFRSSVFFVVYDEGVNDNHGYNGLMGGNVYMSAVSPYSAAGYVDTNQTSHYNLLTTVEWLLGLGSTGHNDNSKFPPMKSLFDFPPSPPPYAATLGATVSANHATGATPLTVQFSGSATGGTAPYTYSWKFGDGNVGTNQNPLHLYTKVGVYSPTLTVKDHAGHSASASTRITVSVPGVVGTLVSGARVATTSPSFWSIDAQTSCDKCIYTNPTVRSYLSQSPFRWVRYDAQSDQCYLPTNTFYSDAGQPSKGCALNISALKSWCYSTTPHCHAILTLPGENNNSAMDAAVAKWVVQTIGFQPDYWNIGNEPMGWTHYGIPFAKWRTTDNSTPTPLAYAFDVKAAIKAVLAVDPAAKFIGVEAACQCNTVWFQDVAKIDGSSIAAIAYHTYPSLGLTSETLQQFYEPLSSTHNLTTSSAQVRAAIHGLCANCDRLPIFVNEYNAGPGWHPSNFGGTYANAAFLAVSVIQALRANLSQLTIFGLQTYTTSFGYSMLNGQNAVSPPGRLFIGILSHLVTGKVYATGVRAAGGGVWSVLTTSGTSGSLLVVNLNLNHSVTLSLGKVFPLGILGTTYRWAPGGLAPSSSSGLTLGSYTVPSQGILLVRVATGFGPMMGPLSTARDAVAGGSPTRALASGESAPSPVAFVPATISAIPPAVHPVGFPSSAVSARAQPTDRPAWLDVSKRWTASRVVDLAAGHRP